MKIEFTYNVSDLTNNTKTVTTTNVGTPTYVITKYATTAPLYQICNPASPIGQVMVNYDAVSVSPATTATAVTVTYFITTTYNINNCNVQLAVSTTNVSVQTATIGATTGIIPPMPVWPSYKALTSSVSESYGCNPLFGKDLKVKVYANGATVAVKIEKCD